MIELCDGVLRIETCGEAVRSLIRKRHPGQERVKLLMIGCDQYLNTRMWT